LCAASDEQYESIPDDEIVLLVRKFCALHKFHKARGVWIRPSLFLIMALTFYLFRFMLTVSFFVGLLTLLCPDFRK
jgi:hypothetical protein